MVSGRHGAAPLNSGGALVDFCRSTSGAAPKLDFKYGSGLGATALLRLVQALYLFWSQISLA
jgi:hypothetical protein